MEEIFDSALSSPTPETGDILGDTTTPVMEVTVEIPPRPFFTTPLDDYTVTEGLLLLLVLFALLGLVYKLWKEVF